LSESHIDYANDIRFFIHFRLPCDEAMYDFNYRIQSLTDELEPHCESLMAIHCDVARNLSEDLNEMFAKKKGTFILNEEMTLKALDYTVYVDIHSPDESLDKLISTLSHIISEVSPPAKGEDFDYSVGVDIEPVEKYQNEDFIMQVIQKTQDLSAGRTESLSPLALYEFNTFKSANNNKTPIDMLNASLDAGMVVFDPPYQADESIEYSSKGTAYIYGDVNQPAALVDDQGEPVIMARYNDESMTPQGDKSTFVPGWVVLRVIVIPKMPTLDVVAHCLNNHPMMAGFGDGVFSFISPVLLLSGLDSARYLMMLDTVFGGFVDGNGATFIDHIDANGECIAEVPMVDMYQYLLNIESLYEVAGDFSVELLKDSIKEFRFSEESYDTEHIVKH
tara:strand:+ start:4183 stop:5355 length:1173 start_codon:yes stop_codon:yes gene_type:complete